jgi:hypothetical protein
LLGMPIRVVRRKIKTAERVTLPKGRDGRQARAGSRQGWAADAAMGECGGDCVRLGLNLYSVGRLRCRPGRREWAFLVVVNVHF